MESASGSRETVKKFGGILPLYMIGGLLFAGVLASGMIAKITRGDKVWGEQCKKSRECAKGVCFPDDTGTSRCMRLCGEDKTCPVGYRCVTKTNQRRRSVGMVSICVEK